MPRIKGRVDGPILVETQDKTWIVEKGATVESATNAIYESIANGNTYIIHGVVKATDGAIVTDSNEATIRVSDTGKLIGGIVAGTATLSIENAGTIRFTDYAIEAIGNEFDFVNSGHVEGDSGVVATTTSDVRIINKSDGSIAAETTAISIRASAGSTIEIINHGSIRSAEAIYLNGDTDDYVVNTGTIEGEIYLGDGNDVIDLTGGRMVGPLNGDEGDDTLITDSREHVLTEQTGEGLDLVKSTVSYELSENVEYLTLLGKKDINGFGNDGHNILRGNGGDNILRGRLGDDELSGGAGRDRLYGGDGDDTFVFRQGFGRDVVFDFDIDTDWFDFEDWDAIESLQDLVDNHMFQDGSDTIIRAGKDSLRIKDWDGEFVAPLVEI